VFGSAPDFALGMEEELLLVDPETHALAHRAGELLADLEAEAGTIKPDTYEALIELATPVVRDADEGAAILGRLRAQVRAAGTELLGAGIHPDGAFGDVVHIAEERYVEIAESLRGLLLRTPTAALHVHVGMPDAATAIHVFNHLRSWLPLFQGLAANSPFWHGRDSGLSSSRSALFRGLPRSVVPRAFADIDEWREVTDAVVAVGELEDYTFLWWDLRPHPNLGTVELRAMDSQSSLAAVQALAALVQGLAIDAARRPAPPRWPATEAISESSFRAARDGLQARIWHETSLRPLAEVAQAALQRAPDAREGVERLVRDGGGAQRQRAAFARGGMPVLLRYLVDDT
jgi:glutamate---cysteine ligase / carboxylate-amine ligase